MLDAYKTDLGFIEGPIVCRDGSVVLTSIDRGLLYRLTDDKSEKLAVTGGGPNGAVEGRDGIFVAQNGGAFPALNEVKAVAGVQKVTADGRLSQVLAGPTAPNDLAFGPDGWLYVTDPTRRPERDDGRVWRCNAETGEGEIILRVGWYPNGIGFSAEDDCFYVADTGGRRIVRFPLKGATAEKAETVLTMTRGMPDGFAFDSEGNFVIAGIGMEDAEAGTVQVWSRQGKLLEVVEPKGSRFITNLAIAPGGKIYVCDSGKGQLLRGNWQSKPLLLHPFRK